MEFVFWWGRFMIYYVHMNTCKRRCNYWRLVCLNTDSSFFVLRVITNPNSSQTVWKYEPIQSTISTHTSNLCKEPFMQMFFTWLKRTKYVDQSSLFPLWVFVEGVLSLTEKGLERNEWKKSCSIAGSQRFSQKVTDQHYSIPV